MEKKESIDENFEFDKDIGCGYGLKDGKIYFKNGLMVKDADVSTFKPIAINFAEDKNYTYYQNKKMAKVGEFIING